MFIYNITSRNTQNTYSRATQMHTHTSKKVTSSSKRGAAGSRRFLVNYCTRRAIQVSVATLPKSFTPLLQRRRFAWAPNYLYIQAYTQRKKLEAPRRDGYLAPNRITQIKYTLHAEKWDGVLANGACMDDISPRPLINGA